jgi:hypothetical protein
MRFVFFHVGDDLALPTQMVASVHAHNPGAEVIQVTDGDTPTVPGVTWSFVTEIDRQYLMLARTGAWADLGLDSPALYLDTDMVINAPINVEGALGEGSVAMCRRSYNRDAIFNVRQRGLEFPEYAGRTLDDLYPYVGCCTITQDAGVWADLTELYYALPEKFWRWYGDQEVLREYAKRHPVVELPESIWAGLPEFGGRPLITHYKGARKKLLSH